MTSVRRLAAAVSALTCMGVVGVGTAVPAGADGLADGAQKTSAAGKYQRQAFRATNGNREAHDLKALKKQDCVQRFAVRQAKAMAAQKSMYHQELGPIMGACGLDTVGENVAYGFASGRAVVNAGWMNSDGHRANILSPAYTLMGIGARQSSDGTWYVAQVFGRRS